MFNIKKGFTLIELLVVIGLLAVISAGVVALINPQDKLNAGNDAGVQNSIGEIGTAAQAYAATHSGNYPGLDSDTVLVTTGDLTVWPTSPNGTITDGSTCAVSGGAGCTRYTVYAPVKSKKYASSLGVATGTGGTVAACGAANAYWLWTSNTGKACLYCGAPVADGTMSCP